MRKITLKADRLAELTYGELEAVAAGAETSACPTHPCITRPVTGIWCLLTGQCV